MNKFNLIPTARRAVLSAFVLTFFAVATDSRAEEGNATDCQAEFESEMAACAKLVTPQSLQCLDLWIAGKIGGIDDCLRGESCMSDAGFKCLATANRNLESCLRGERRTAFVLVCVAKFGKKSILD